MVNMGSGSYDPQKTGEGETAEKARNSCQGVWFGQRKWRGRGGQTVRGRGKEQGLGAHRRKLLSSRPLPDCLGRALKGKEPFLHPTNIPCSAPVRRRPRGEVQLPCVCAFTSDQLSPELQKRWNRPPAPLLQLESCLAADSTSDMWVTMGRGQIASGLAGRKPGEIPGPFLSQVSP